MMTLFRNEDPYAGQLVGAQEEPGAVELILSGGERHD